MSAEIEKEISRVSAVTVPPSQKLNDILTDAGTTPVSTGIKLIDLIKRPQLGYDALTPIDTTRPPLKRTVRAEAETRIKYEGYITRQLEDAAKLQKLETHLLPEDIDYTAIDGLRLEARQKLSKIRPLNIGQASRISGVSPADISVLLIWLKLNKRK